MKLLTIIISSFFIGLSSAYAKASCQLTRSGVQKNLIFQDYDESITDDPDDPACRFIMSRVCSKVKISSSTLSLPRGVWITHQKWSYERGKKDFSFFSIRVQDKNDLLFLMSQTRPKAFLRAQIAKILDGGYRVECRD